MRLSPGTKRAAYLRPKPTADELRQGAEHLLYEVQMVSNTVALFEDESSWNKGYGWQSKTLYMANLESFLVHMRALMDFVCPPRKWETRQVNERGIFAADYCKAWGTRPWPTLREQHKQISREIQHLTLDRPSVGRNWEYAEMLRKLRKELLRFIDEADGLPSEIGDSLRGILEREVRVSTTNTAAPPLDITPFLGSDPGMSRATTGFISSGE